MNYQEVNMETRKKIPFFSATFTFILFISIHFWSHLWFIMFCKIPQFRAKATNLDSPPYFSLNQTTLKFSKIYIIFCPLRRAKKGISSWTINITKTFHLINSKNLLGKFNATTAPDFWKMHLIVLLKMCLRILL